MHRSAYLVSIALFLSACSEGSENADTSGSSETSSSSDTSESSETSDASETSDGAETSDASDTDDPPPAPAETPGELGPFTVGHTQLTAIDPDRDDRSLLVDVWYPADSFDEGAAERAGYLLGGFLTLPSQVAWSEVPVSARPDQTFLVFSHGYRAINTQSFELCETLASHGFIVAAPEHTGNSQTDASSDFDAAAADRVPDVSFLIDYFLAKATDPEDMFHDRLDGEAVGVVGHSFGGMTSIGAVAGWAGAPADPRVKAVAPISAVIDSTLQQDERISPFAGFSEAQLASVTAPVMLIGGTADTGVPVANNELAFDQLDAAPAVYRADIIGANHTHFSNVCAIGNLLIQNGIPQEMWEAFGAGDLIGPYNATCGPDAFPIAEATRLQNVYVVAFFRKHLLGEADYDHYLSPEYADTEPAITYWER